MCRFQLEIPEPLPVYFLICLSQVGAKTLLIIFMVAIFSFQAFSWSFGDFYTRVKIVCWVTRFSFAGEVVPMENHVFYTYTGGGTTLSQGDRSGAVKHAQKKDALAKIMIFKYLKRLIMCLNTPFMVFDRSSCPKWWYGKSSNMRTMMPVLGKMWLP